MSKTGKNKVHSAEDKMSVSIIRYEETQIRIYRYSTKIEYIHCYNSEWIISKLKMSPVNYRTHFLAS